MQPLVSIILPAYNSSKTLRRAILSVQNQIFNDWELIIVNDGSTDNTQEISELYAKQDIRINVINQKNKGRSLARNAGLKIVKGKYITFLDSDDIYLPNTLQDLVNNNLKYNSDLIIGGICYNKRKKHIFKNEYLEGKNAIKYLFLLIKNKITFNSVCNKLFKKDIIQRNNLSFSSNMEMGEDMVFVMKYCNEIQSLSTIDTIIYNYYPNIQSITKKSFKSSYIDRNHTFHYLLLNLYKKWNLSLDEVYGSFFNYKMFGCTFAASTSFSLLKKMVKETFIDSNIINFANKVNHTKYDNLFAKLIRYKQVIIWTFIAYIFGLLKRIKN